VHIPEWVIKPFVLAILLYRRLRYGYTFRRIPLTRGKFAIVDPEDYEWLSKYKWNAQKSPKNCYAKRMPHKCGKRVLCLMHREILKVPKHLVVDHINHDGLDNRKANLRPATISQNALNRPYIKHSSKFKGVTFDKENKNWRSEITYEKQKIHLGKYDDEIEAAKAYDEAAKKYHGEFASLNFGK
jgi:hypothetical protein